ncbi:secreted RxLR effector protein 161-like [Nicotiana tomentosiformis]|uniref:secreted RxLR effector protein 161-like n=1 Tax=Nicotiana tomentosiformis TaxID=4098 RepID=UPI0008785C97|nr:secreted RxLR effector protein 161-like [Nicotiana tomentosiformis]
MYKGIIGSLLYLTTSRPDIVFSVVLCARFQSNPKESHLKAAKRILRYLKVTQDLVLYYLLGDNFDLNGYAYTDYASYLVDRKSTSGMAHFLGSCLISWGTRKQNSVALSTVETEYVAAASCCAQLLWIKQQLEDFGVFFDCVPLLCDNTALNMAKNPVDTHGNYRATKKIVALHVGKRMRLTFTKLIREPGSLDIGVVPTVSSSHEAQETESKSPMPPSPNPTQDSQPPSAFL